MMRYFDQPPYNFIHLEETGSTNSYFKLLREKGNVDAFTVATAEYQSAGRGQRGNFWESERTRNLTFSIYIRPAFLLAKKQFLLSQIISLSIKEELDRYATGFCIKWPNDIYHNEQKICGILIENNLTEDRISESIIGIGVNINQQIFNSTAPNPVSLRKITGDEYDREMILKHILCRFYDYYRMLEKESLTELANKYHKALFRKEGFHLFSDKNGKFSAKTQRVEPDGTLVLLDTKGCERNYNFKEVSFILS